MTGLIPRTWAWAVTLPMAMLGLPASVQAQGGVTTDAPNAWQACTVLRDDAARLACFDQWSARQSPASATPPASEPAPAAASDATTPALTLVIRPNSGCRNATHSDASRYWELEAGTDCSTFNIRGYRPISLSWIGSNGVNLQPTSGNPLNNATTSEPYSRSETRIQLSVRTKIAQGLLKTPDPELRDSLWFGYTQQSYWQLFNGELSRPFRTTDHEPELIYIYPLQARSWGGWQLRYGGLGVVHQSNGQPLPLSRSWNRVYLMAGADLDRRWSLIGRVWQRLPEKEVDDDNPRIADYIGRGELTAAWNASRDDTLSLTLRHSLRQTAYGSLRLQWLRRITDSEQSGLRFHTQLFSGYGDSLVDFNRRRTVLSVGLSLVDF